MRTEGLEQSGHQVIKGLLCSGVQARALLLPLLPFLRPPCSTVVRGAACSAYMWTYAEY